MHAFNRANANVDTYAIVVDTNVLADMVLSRYVKQCEMRRRDLVASILEEFFWC